MANTVDSTALKQLPATQRLRLIAELWESLTQESGAVPIPQGAEAEASRRIDELKANPDRGISLQEYRKKRGWKA